MCVLFFSHRRDRTRTKTFCKGDTHRHVVGDLEDEFTLRRSPFYAVPGLPRSSDRVPFAPCAKLATKMGARAPIENVCLWRTYFSG